MANMDKKEIEARQVYETVHTEGWENIYQFIKNNLDIRENRITTTEFTDLTKVARLQGEITGLRKILDYVEAQVKRVEGGN